MSYDEIKLGKYMTAYRIRLAKRDAFDVKDSHGSTLGHVEWYPRWRQYVFSPEPNSVFSHDCLAELSAFCRR